MIKTYRKHQILEPNRQPNTTDAVGFGLIWRAVIERKVLVFSLLFIVVTLPILYLVIKYKSPIQAAWMNDSWGYRQTVAITNAGTAQTDFQVAITLNTSALVTAGKMQSDCDDIRITDVSGKVLPIWIETNGANCNTTVTRIWTKVPSISTTGVTVYLYYGNPSAANIENGNNVFQFFDDFSGSLDTSKWTQGAGTWTTTGGSLQTSNYYSGDLSHFPVIYSTNYSSSDYVVESNLRNSVPNTGDVQINVDVRVQDANNFYRYGYRAGEGEMFKVSSGGYSLIANNGSWTIVQNTWYRVATQTLSSTIKGKFWTATSSDPGTWGATYTDGSPYTSGKVGLEGSYTSATPQYDFIFVRKTAATEPAIAAPTNEEKSAGPVAYWKFDEGYGTNANNSTSVTGVNGTISGATWQSEDQCISGKCLYFDGTADNVAISSAISLGTQFTFSHWIRTSSSAGQMYTIGNAGGGNGYRYGISSGLVAFLVGNASVYTESACGTTTVNDNKWHLITGVFDNSAGNFKCYIDGRYEASVNIVDFSGMQTAAPGIGAPPCCTDTSGFIDEPKIYNYARTAAQIKSDFASKGSGSVKGTSVAMGSSSKSNDAFSNGLVGYWKMDEAAANSCTGGVNDSCDASGNGLDGAWNGTNIAAAAGKYGNAVNFNGTDDYVSLGSNIIMGGTNSALSFWFKVNAFGGMFVGKAADNDTYIYPSNSTTINVQTDTVSTEKTFTVPTMSTGTWYYLVVTRDNNTTHVYLNGTESSSGGQSQTPDLTINQFGRYSSYPGYWYNGVLDELRIYNRALSPKEVRDLYAWAPGPVGYWNLDEKTATTANDSSGNGNNSNSWNNSPTWTNGKFGGALTLNGTNSWIGTATSSTLDNTKAFTVEAWINPNSTVNEMIVGNTMDNFELYLDNGSLKFYVRDGAGWGSPVIGGSVSTGSWTHVVGIFNGSTISTYINGVLSGTPVARATTLVSGNFGFNVGTYANGSGWFFAGKIDDIRFYNYARSSKQIVEDMNAGHPAPGSPVGSQVGYWKMDEGYGDTANNSGNGGSAINGNLAGSGGSCPGAAACPTWNQNGKFGKALSFDGSNDYVDISSSNFDFAGKDFTISLWTYYYGYISHGSAWNCLVGRDDAFSTTGYGVCTNSNNQVQFSAGNVQVNSSVNITNGWHHIVAVHDSVTPQLRIYVDGVPKNTAAYTNQLTSKVTALAAIGEDSQGSRQANSLIDEVKIYNSALTEDEIKLDYNRGSAMVLGDSVEDTSDNAVGYWKLDESGTTTITIDSSGNDNNGTLQNFASPPPWTSSGKINGALDFAGDNDYISTSISTHPTAFTVEAWANTDVTDATIDTIVSKFTGGPFNGFFLRHSSGSMTAQVYNAGTGYVSYATITAGVWNHWAMTFDGSTIRLYKDGVQTDSDPGTMGTTTQTLVIGGNYTGPSETFDGKIDHVKYYTYARSASQIAADAATDVKNPILPGAPVAEWKMDEKTGANAYDTSGNGNTGTLGGSASWTTGQVGAAIKFSDATDDKVTFSSPVLNTPPYTVCAWTKPDSITDGDYHYIIGNGGESGGYYGFYIYLTNTGTWQLGVRNSAGLTGAASIAASNINWAYICGTWDGTSSSGAIKLYVNGSLAATGTAAGTSSVSASNLKIGGASLTDAYNWDGKIDQVRIYNYARTPAQVAYDYNRGGPVGWWKMDECQGGTANDASGNGNNGTITIGATGSQTAVGTCTTSGTAWYNGVTGKYNSSLNFDGTDDYSAYTSAGFLPTGDNPKTINFWFKPSAGMSDANIAVGYGCTDTEGYGCASPGVGKYVGAWANTSSIGLHLETCQVNGPSTPTPTTGWHLYTAVFNGNNTVTFYIDGTSPTTVTPGCTVNTAIGKGISIGAGRWGYYNGQIDDVKIFNYAVTANQVKSLYNAGAAVQFAPATGSP